jgi:hypothetical protein
MKVIMKIFKLNKLSAHAKLGVGTLLTVILTTGLVMAPVYAQDMTKGCEHKHLDGEHQHAFFEQHQKELHDKLVLTANQEPAWKVFVEKTKPTEQPDGGHQSSEWAKLKTPERLDLMLSKMKAHEQRLESHAKATKEFYQQLTPAQKTVFDQAFVRHAAHQR